MGTLTSWFLLSKVETFGCSTWGTENESISLSSTLSFFLRTPATPLMLFDPVWRSITSFLSIFRVLYGHTLKIVWLHNNGSHYCADKCTMNNGLLISSIGLLLALYFSFLIVHWHLSVTSELSSISQSALYLLAGPQFHLRHDSVGDTVTDSYITTLISDREKRKTLGKAFFLKQTRDCWC